MTKDQLTKHLTNMATLAGVPASDVQKIADNAREIGFLEFWNCRPWTFRTVEYTLVITAAADEYVLPDDFRAIRSVREKETLDGYQLRYMGKEEFDYNFPKQEALHSDKPRIYTVYRKNGKFYIKLAPRPSAMSVYIDYLGGTPGDILSVPDEAAGALVAVCEKYIYPAKSAGRVDAAKIAQVEIADLENREGVFGGTIFKFFDDTDYIVDTTRPWI